MRISLDETDAAKAAMMEEAYRILIGALFQDGDRRPFIIIGTGTFSIEEAAEAIAIVRREAAAAKARYVETYTKATMSEDDHRQLDALLSTADRAMSCANAFMSNLMADLEKGRMDLFKAR